MADDDEDVSHLRAPDADAADDADEGEESAAFGSWTKLMCVPKHQEKNTHVT